MAFQDFDLISQRRQQERKDKIRRRITVAVATVVVLLLLVGAAVGTIFYRNNNEHVGTEQNTKSHSSSSSPSSSTSHSASSSSSSSSSHSASTSPEPVANVAQEAVKKICAETDYKKTCEDGIKKEIGEHDKVKPEEIVKASFAVAMDEVDKAGKEAKGYEFDTPFKKAALNDCMVLLNDAKEELNTSISSIKGKQLDDMSVVTHEIKNWLSAVMSYQQTCIDGFPDGAEKEKMEKLLKTGKEAGSNALAIVSQVSSVLKAFHGSNAQRRLFAEDEEEPEKEDGGVPSWIDGEGRRVLKADRSIFTPNVTVAKDGSGNFTTINAALEALPDKYKGRFVIYIKEGVYEENVIITKKMENLTMYGEGSQKSIITGNKNYVDGVPTYQTATFAAIGEGFLAQSLGFRNTAGPEKHQAVALRVQSDRSIFVNCRMEGYQDTLYAQTHRQFYRSCYITGTVDFIFGDAAVVFQNCMIVVRKPMESQKNTITAQGRIDKRETRGIVIQNCKILADEQLEPVKDKFKSYLGRPWKEYSKTIIMETEIGDLISPEGWLEWSGDFALKTLYYAEYNNKGPGADTAGRVTWPGYKKSFKRDDALKYSVGPFLEGESWLKNTDVPVRFGMFT